MHGYFYNFVMTLIVCWPVLFEDVVKANFLMGLLQGVQYLRQGLGHKVFSGYGAPSWATEPGEADVLLMREHILRKIESMESQASVDMK